MNIEKKFQSIKNAIMLSAPFGEEYKNDYTCDCNEKFTKYKDYSKHVKSNNNEKREHDIKVKTINYQKKYYYYLSGRVSYISDSFWIMLMTIFSIGFVSTFIFILIQYLFPDNLLFFTYTYQDGETQRRAHFWVVSLALIIGILFTAIPTRWYNKYKIKKENLSYEEIFVYPVTRNQIIFICFLLISFLFLIISILVNFLEIYFPQQISFGSQLGIIIILIIFVSSLIFTYKVIKQINLIPGKK